MLEDMETPLIGKQAGDEVNLSLEFPKDYHGVSVAGKKAEFHVIVHKVLESKLAELGSDLFKKIGISTEKEEDFLKEVRSNMEKRLEHASSMKLKSEIVDRLLSLNPLKLPKVLVENEINRAKQRFGQERGIDSNKLPDSLKKRFEEEAKRAVHTSLLLSEISKKEKIKPDLQRVKLKISDIAASYGKESQKIADLYYNNDNLLREIEALVLEDQIFDELKKQIEIKEKNISYEEAINA